MMKYDRETGFFVLWLTRDEVSHMIDIVKMTIWRRAYE